MGKRDARMMIDPRVTDVMDNSIMDIDDSDDNGEAAELLCA